MKTISLEDHVNKIEKMKESYATAGLHMLIGSLILVVAFFFGHSSWIGGVLLPIGLLFVAIGYTGTLRS